MGASPQALKRLKGISGRLWARFRDDEGGQAIVEYLLMLSIVTATFMVVFGRFQGALFGLWKSVIRDVRAPCPGCSPSGQP